ncbi:MAG TPA: hypothetical protein VHR18_14235 [Solirubrobacterales bacterium]|jgi:hypothetical protein|nr:hypothetical protein [Solirubrobacterales bacterium]
MKRQSKSVEDRVRRPNWVEKAGIGIAVVSVVVAVIALGNGSDESGTSDAAPSKLTVVDLMVRDAERSPQPRPHLEITLHNTGGKRAVIDGARVTVQRIFELRRCASQDDLPLTNTYGMSLPAEARAGQAFETPLHQQVGPDEADRFAIGFHTRPPADSPSSIFLFQIDIALRNDGPRPVLPIGTAVVALPELPLVGEYFWDRSTAEVIRGFAVTEPDYVRYLQRFAMPCWRSNTKALRQASSGSARHSALLEQISADLVTPNNSSLE